MIQRLTQLAVVDNSGVLRIRCIQVQGGRRPRGVAAVGDPIRATVRAARPGSGWKSGDLVRAVVVRTVKGGRNPAGIRRDCDLNGAVLVSATGEPLAARRAGPRPRERRRRGRGKLASLAARRA